MVEQMTLLNLGLTHNEEAILNTLKHFRKKKISIDGKQLKFDYIFFGSANNKGIIAQAFIKYKVTGEDVFTILIKNSKELKQLELILKELE